MCIRDRYQRRVREVDRDVLKTRCLGRRIDPVTGVTYHVKFNPPPASVASRCITRPDDTEERLEKRINIYEKERADLLAVFKDEAMILNGNRNMNHVFAEFNTQLSAKLYKKERVDAAAGIRKRATRRSKL
eukprot:TRINITY_DN59066_c0_g1_i1.p1 TRINITY_DN59066_c0_g1~~TRINITY_DN59066_c0_g1_i1.p1  ORF type:complete len:131 (-),score=43.49 TRINITY_DN59066_c0_g1_i1:432-824(-)